MTFKKYGTSMNLYSRSFATHDEKMSMLSDEGNGLLSVREKVESETLSKIVKFIRSFQVSSKKNSIFFFVGPSGVRNMYKRL